MVYWVYIIKDWVRFLLGRTVNTVRCVQTQ